MVLTLWKPKPPKPTTNPDATGFIRLHALRLKVRATVQEGKQGRKR